MSKYRGLSDFVGFNSEFRNAINLDLNLNHKEKLLSYIPTKSSVDILKRYLKSVVNNQMHSSMLIGPYGKGKSHLLLVLLAILSLDVKDSNDKEVLNKLISRIKKVDDEAAEYIEKIISDSLGRFLPVIINCQEDVNQAFLLGLNKALKRNGLDDLTPKTDYIYASEIIDTWKRDYPDTYEEYHTMLKAKKISLNAMKAELLQFNREYLDVFRDLYPQLTSGSVFNPLAEADVTRVYMSVADKLREEYGYRGIYIVFDEFSKFIEGQDKISAGLNMKLVQDACEMACDSKDPQIYITLVAHKPIKEYGNRLSQETINSFTGIEGRLDAEVLFVTSAKNNYELIENAIIKNQFDVDKLPKDVKDKYFSENSISESFALPGYESEFTREDFERIVVKGCYPLTPVAAYLLLSISEKVAQNERTLFTFISKDEPGSMPEYIKSSFGTEYVVSSFWSVTPDLIFDYFTTLFKDESDDIKIIYQKAITALEIALKKYSQNDPAIRIIKTLAAMMIVGKNQELPWNEDVLRLAVNMSYSEEAKEKFSDVLTHLFEMDILELDGNNYFKFKTVEGKELESVIEERWRLVANEKTVKDVLQTIFPNKYVFPKKYNYEYGMTRYFRYAFCDVEDFLAIKNADVFFENAAFCDGRIICIFQHNEKDYTHEISKKVEELASHKIVVMYAHKMFEVEEDVLRIQLLKDIKEDYHFIEKNGHLLSEIQGLEENLESKIQSSLNLLYGRFGDYKVVYYLNGNVVSNEKASISECIDELCYQIFNETPVVNNEFVNKQNITTGATKTARKNIMEKLLNKDSLDDYMTGTSQDATIFRALFVRNGLINGEPEAKIANVMQLFENYVSDCAGKRRKLSELMNVITGEPYGIRLGLIPVYMSYVVGKRTSDIIVYYGDKEIPLTSDTIINMCDYPEQYELYVSETDADKEEYLAGIIKCFNINIDGGSQESRISQIFNGMQKWYRALPQITTNVKNNKEYFKETYYTKALTRMSNLLQRYEVNPYEALYVQIPEAFGTKDDLKLCGKRIAIFKDKLNGYYEWILNKTVEVTKKVFGEKEDSLYHLLIDWYETQSDKAKGTIDDQTIASFMQLLSSMKNKDITQITSDVDVIDSVVKSIMGVHIDYWNDSSINKYLEKLREIKGKIESINDIESASSNSQAVYVSRTGQHFYYEIVENDETEMFKDMLAGTIEDFEGLGKNDLIAVLLGEVERILNSKE